MSECCGLPTFRDNAVEWSTVPGCNIDADTVDQYKLEKGDILIARTGGTIGKTFLVRDVPVTAVFASYLIRVQSTRQVFDEYLKLFLEFASILDLVASGHAWNGSAERQWANFGNVGSSPPTLHRTTPHRGQGR